MSSCTLFLKLHFTFSRSVEVYKVSEVRCMHVQSVYADYCTSIYVCQNYAITIERSESRLGNAKNSASGTNQPVINTISSTSAQNKTFAKDQPQH